LTSSGDSATAAAESRWTISHSPALRGLDAGRVHHGRSRSVFGRHRQMVGLC
jgi:hypothetical protein